MAMNLYTSFNRLKNIPLDLTCIYKTLDDATAYVERDHTKAYAGQIIAVYGEESSSSNNGIYNVIPSADSASGLGLQKSANADDLAALKKEIDEEVKQRIAELDDKFDGIQSDLDALKQELSDEFFAQIKETQANVEKLGNDLEAAKAEFDAKIDAIYGGTGIQEAFDTIKEIADWIDKNQDVIKAFTAIEQKIVVLEQDTVPALQKKDTELETAINANKADISSIKDSISELTAKDTELQASIEDLSGKIDRHKSFTMDICGNNAFKVSDVILETVEVYIATANSDAAFYCSIEDVDGNGTYLIRSNDPADENTDNDYSLIDLSEAGRRYIYNLGCELQGDKYIRFQTPGDSSQTMQLKIRFTISKPNTIAA